MHRALFCGGYYWYMYLLAEPDIAIDSIYYDRLDGIEKGEPVIHAPSDEESVRKKPVFWLRMSVTQRSAGRR
ncbi:hypothetical protein BU26DRAFT_513640 [Trematosphaeria pertusa]|uniref:Uncharacterized protein n=1 Tax=Trematosphaeria pertusa TaxID=390896 RepID=A0A6A6J2U5_9PLEO|nr:uncharacterized protein BU26DRAFT_513640 [Trematosphaeria pertusa]KAF2256888.1 hypothetical protein BU26DRAFT_513640 [Trematosphaeria pertusa]